MTKKQRAILLAVVTLLLCVALIAGGTYALFSAEVELSNHLQAGELDVTLERIHLTSYALDPVTGYMKEIDEPDSPPVDFSEGTTDNVFGITEDTLIVPCSSYTATMRITNNGNVAFGYWLEIKMNNTGDGRLTQEEIAKLELDKQLVVKLKTEDDADWRTVSLSEGLNIGSAAAPVGKLAKAATDDGAGNLSHSLPSSETFMISVEFLNDLDSSNDLLKGDNNKAQNQQLWLDLIVHAVQLPEKAPTQSTP